MARTPEFEDMDFADYGYDSPSELPVGIWALRQAGHHAYAAYVELDEALTRMYQAPDPKGYHEAQRLTLVELTGQTWALLKTIRAEGQHRLFDLQTPAGDRAMRNRPGEPNE